MSRPHETNCGLIGSVDVADLVDPLYNELVVWFPFTSKHGLNDIGPQRIQVSTTTTSGPAYVGTLAGGSQSALSVVADATTPLGSSALFTGANWINLSNSYLNNGGWPEGGDWTIECWVKRTTDTYGFRGIVGAPDFVWLALQEAEGGTGNNGLWYFWCDQSNSAGWELDFNALNDGSSGKPGRTALNTWHHICIQRCRDSISFYIDGKWCRSASYPVNVIVNSGADSGSFSWYVGASQEAGLGSPARPSPVTATSGPRTWMGNLSQFRIYKCAKYHGRYFEPSWDVAFANAYPNPLSGVLTL